MSVTLGPRTSPRPRKPPYPPRFSIDTGLQPVNISPVVRVTQLLSFYFKEANFMRRNALIFSGSLMLVSLTGCSTIAGWFKKEPKQEPIAAEPYQDPYAGQAPVYQPMPAHSAAPMGGGRTHTVAKGETLYAIARQYYGDQSKWKTIYDANRGELPDPNRIRAGQRLVIP